MAAQLIRMNGPEARRPYCFDKLTDFWIAAQRNESAGRGSNTTSK